MTVNNIKTVTPILNLHFIVDFVKKKRTITKTDEAPVRKIIIIYSL